MQGSEETRSIDQMDHIFDHDTYCHMHQTSHVKCIAFHATHLKRHTYSDTCVYVEMCVCEIVKYMHTVHKCVCSCKVSLQII